MITEQTQTTRESVMYMPGLNFLGDLKNAVKSGDKCLIDTNIFFPIFYDRNHQNTIQDKNLATFIDQNCYNGKMTNECLKKIFNYAEQYTQQLRSLVSENENLNVIDQVVKECKNANEVITSFYRRARENVKKGNLNSNTMKCQMFAEKLIKLKKNSLESCLFELVPNRVISTSNLMNETGYREIFEIVLNKAESYKVAYNELKTDLHILSTAAYLSSQNKRRINVISFDDHLISLMGWAWSGLESYLCLQKLGFQEITVYHPVLKKEGFGIERLDILPHQKPHFSFRLTDKK